MNNIFSGLSCVAAPVEGAVLKAHTQSSGACSVNALPGDAEAVLGCFLCSLSPKTSLKQTNHRRCIEYRALGCIVTSAEGFNITRYVI